MLIKTKNIPMIYISMIMLGTMATGEIWDDEQKVVGKGSFASLKVLSSKHCCLFVQSTIYSLGIALTS